jgi:sulfonate transport system substrate-binding protein
MRVTRSALVAAALSAPLAWLAPALSAEPVKFRVAYIVPAGDGPLALLGKPGIAQHEGKSYTLEFSHFTGTPLEISALAANEVDIAPLSFPTFPLAIENAKLDDLRIIADGLEDGVENYYSVEFMVLNDAPIKTIDDLKGKVITANGFGSGPDISLRMMLRKRGFEDKRDYTLIETAFPNMKAVLLDRKADLIAVTVPFSQDAQLRSQAHTLFRQKDAIGLSQLIFLTARSAFLQKNRAAVVDFLEDNLREIRWYYDPANHDAAVKAITDFTKSPAALWSSWVFTTGDLYRAANGKPDLDALTRNIKTTYEAGFLKDGLDPKKYADLSLVEEAGKRLP